ncbi:hypothetical protein ILUMI_21961 [Ignelater luminosus]|uniref:Glycine-rich protein n=1 Tax=Ignelater luminosus TaxID=2038154 RepID=A0A8K0CER3_IGNLU|nr:hypothetical protein ILUMI_21961 [Ignelater luminosus]
MVYISNGAVCQDPPWSIRRLTGFFWGIIAFVLYFFKTLVGLDRNSSGSNGSKNGRGGGRGGPDGPGGGPRRIGRITTIDDCSMPGGG